jgi:transposase InsO family protein
MQRELEGKPQPYRPPHRRGQQTPKAATPHSIDIAAISLYALNMTRRMEKARTRTELQVNQITLHEVDHELDYRKAPPDEHVEETTEDMLRRTMPKGWHDLIDTFCPKDADKLPPHRQYDHKIQLEGEADPKSLGYTPLWALTDTELEVLKAYITENLDKGFIEPSYAPFAAPILFVRKANGQLRLCVDYRKLNAVTVKDRFPLPLIDETIARLSKAKVFTKLDVRAAFNRIRMHPDSEELTTFRTRYGCFKSKVLPFGLTNGPATFQRYINDVLFDLLDITCTAYLDDIIIFSNDPAEHKAHVRQVLERLQAAGLYCDAKKCEFAVTRTKFLGFIISTNGVEVDPEKIAVIVNWKYPKTLKGVQAFLGFCNFYRRFIKGYGKIAKAMNNLTKKGVMFNFDSKCKEAFDELKNRLTSTPIIHHYDFGKDTMLETDASDGVVSGVLSQKQKDDFWKPIGYFSKTMLPAECNYPIHDKEMLAIIRAFEQWRTELEGLDKPLLVYSDHKALEYFMTTKNLSARQARWAEFLSRYHFKIMYRSGKQNEKADILTRREDDVRQQNLVKQEIRRQALLPESNVDWRVKQEVQLAPLQVDDSFELINKILQTNRDDESLQDFRDQAATDGNKSIWSLRDGLLLYNDKLYVPEKSSDGTFLRTRLIEEAHTQKATAHPGAKKTYHLLKPRYYWNSMGGSVEQYVRNCQACKRSHVPTDKTPGLLHSLPVPDRPWKHISMDFKSFPKDRNGYDTILVVVDRLSKKPISLPCYKTTTARDLARMFIAHVWRYYGAPDSIVSDRGPQFISDFWNQFCTILGVKIKLSTAHHAQTDGQTEIVNKYIDQRLRPFVNWYQDDWSELLPMMDFAQSSLRHESIEQTPFMTILGYEPRTSFDWTPPAPANSAKEKLNREEAQALAKRMKSVWEHAQGHMTRAQERQQLQANKRRREVDFKVGDQVYLSTKHLQIPRPSRKLASQMEGPFRIIQQIGHSYQLQLPATWKIHDVFHAEKLRLHPDDPLPGQTLPEPPSYEVNGDIEWEVEKILSIRLVRNKLKYRVKWVNQDNDPAEYLAENLCNAPMALRDFHDLYPTLPGPPANLDYWLKCAEQDEFPERRDDDNIQVTR